MSNRLRLTIILLGMIILLFSVAALVFALEPLPVLQEVFRFTPITP